jgi:hypothetical protein
MTQNVKSRSDWPLVTTDGHVKGRGLGRKASAHCVDFLEREKAPKG